MRVLLVIGLIIGLMLNTGCSLIPKAQKGGGATVGASVSTTPLLPATGGKTASVTTPQANVMPTATITQPENPKGASAQDVTFEHKVETTTPYDTVKKTVTEYPDGRKVTVEEPVPAGTKTVESTKQKVEQKLGGAWEDTAREIAAKMAALSKVMYVGIAMMVFGAAGLFWAPLKLALGGGKQFPIAVSAIGAVLVVASMVIPGNEGIILGGAVVICLGLWLFIRTTRKETEADMLKIAQTPTVQK